jgi:transcriptional regulator with XRE-family HTH domain
MAAVAEETLGQRLKRLRGDGMSQVELAVKAGVSPSLVAKIEQDENINPKLSTLRALARVLGVTTADLIGPDPEG